MAQTNVIGDQAPREALCPRCRADASWRFLDERKSVIEVICPDCGVFESPRGEFEIAEADAAEPFEP